MGSASSFSAKNQRASTVNKLVVGVAIGLVVLALLSSAALLATDTNLGARLGLPASAISALPLLAAGLSFVIVQPMIYRRWTELLKNLLLAATFILWGAVQLMAQGWLAKILGDAVIALYVLDLTWTILASMKANKEIN
jgi:hypothetical protein